MEKTPVTASATSANVMEAESSGVEDQLTQVTALVHRLTEVPAARAGELAANAAFEDQLVTNRLGMASGLFAALRSKHAPTAAHSLRVALGCSSWAFTLDLPDAARDQLEIAGLLHDVGKIGVPDTILLKPGQLVSEEIELMDRHRLAGLDILRSCCSSPAIVEIVRQAPSWYNGTRKHYPLAGDRIPLGSRMLSIIDAYDSMTTDHLYRRAMSHERAMNELFSYAGTQFDPELVKLFDEQHRNDNPQAKVAAHWLQGLDPQVANSLWQPNTLTPSTKILPEALFQQKMLDNMYDAVVFIDRNLHVILWNRGAERLTGIAGGGIVHRAWLPTLIGMRDEKGRKLLDEDCPITYAVRTGVQSLRRLTITGRNGSQVDVDLHAVPVVGHDGAMHGAAVLLHDASPEASLEKRCQNLHERATKDPLTQVANRAEFDRTHQQFIVEHLERQLPCSLIICDIDHFKQINDTFGHQAGDEALKSFAQMLKAFCRSGDLVARYGGEEFVILCADCNNAAGALRAEQIRKTIAELSQPALGGKRFTVSFGVTEVQPGDRPDTMLRRADRALLEAKQRGRNNVVQLGGGIGEVIEKPKTRWWFFQRTAPNLLLDKWLASSVPMNMLLEKLRGYIADNFAEVVSIEEDRVTLKIDQARIPLLRRTADRPVPFLVELRFFEDQETSGGASGGRVVRTRVHVAIRPKRDRDRRRSDSVERARYLVSGIKSYLMATESEAPAAGSTPGREATLLSQWDAKIS